MNGVIKRVEVKVLHTIGDPNYHYILVPCYITCTDKGKVYIEVYNNNYELLTTISTTKTIKNLS